MAYTQGHEINGRYKLIKLIGRGSFGEVWMAEDNVTGITQAIKIYSQLDEKGIKEFKDEFKTVYKMRHTNLLRSDHFDVAAEQPYLVMPYCPSSVGDMIGEMSEAQIWHFLHDVASGLDYLHKNDIVHRDIKPDNVLLDEDGNYVISDFGLSVKMKSTLRRASGRTNDTGGTIGYMGPELFSARPESVKATDIWALGVTIYELITTELPFCGQGGAMMRAGAEIPFLPGNFSPDLNAVMQLCLAREPWERPRADQLQQWAEQKMQNPNAQLGIARDHDQSQTQQQDTMDGTMGEGHVGGAYADDGATKSLWSTPKPYLMVLAVAALAGFLVWLMMPKGNAGDVVTDQLTIAEAPADTLPEITIVSDFEYRNEAGVVTGTYSGEMVNGKMQGNGVFKFKDGGKAEGKFENNRITTGRQVTDDGYYFDGTFNNGNPYNGTWFTPQGKQYYTVVNGVDQD